MNLKAKKVESLNASVGRLAFSFSPTSHQAISKIYLTKISGNKVVPLN